MLRECDLLAGLEDKVLTRLRAGLSDAETALNDALGLLTRSEGAAFDDLPRGVGETILSLRAGTDEAAEGRAARIVLWMTDSSLSGGTESLGLSAGIMLPFRSIAGAT